MKNRIEKVSSKEAIEALNNGGVRVVIRYKPEKCYLFENALIYADIQHVEYDKDCCKYFAFVDVSGQEIDFNDIVEWLIVYPNEEQLAFRKKLAEFNSKVFKSVSLS